MSKEIREKCKINPIEDTNFVKVEFTITTGKMFALKNALIRYNSPIADDLYQMITRAENQ